MQQQSLGETIRRLRRQSSLTQTDLGGERFSKSYVSAVEREKIIPSYEALRFFAKQLDQPDDFFEKLLEQVEQTKQVAVSTEIPVYDVRAHEAQKRIATFLDIALQEIEHTHFPLLQELSTFAPELITGS